MTTPATATGAAATAPAHGDVLDALEAALAATGALVAGIAATQWSAPTPCPGWRVREVTNHLVGGLRLFTAQLTGTDAGGEHEDDWLGDSPAAAYTAAATAESTRVRRCQDRGGSAGVDGGTTTSVMGMSLFSDRREGIGPMRRDSTHRQTRRPQP